MAHSASLLHDCGVITRGTYCQPVVATCRPSRFLPPARALKATRVEQWSSVQERHWWRRQLRGVESSSGGDTAARSLPADVDAVGATSPPLRRAAFFDVDGTIIKSNIVWPYVFLRAGMLTWWQKVAWVPFFALKGAFYKVIDQFDRSLLNQLFYRNYRGISVEVVPEMAKKTYQAYFKPRMIEAAVARIRELRSEGYLIVLVTGSLSFLIAPLAEELGVDEVLGSELAVENGRFTGELIGGPVSNEGKVERMVAYAQQRGVSLPLSQAYGDSIADLPMLECVGEAFAVRPDAPLRVVATAKGWPVLNWSLQKARGPSPLFAALLGET